MTVVPAVVRLCPRCGENHYTPYGLSREQVEGLDLIRFPFAALSRADNKTYVCSWCGRDEAMREAFGPAPLDLADWAFPPNPEEAA